jgi:ankyrin repeat protein
LKLLVEKGACLEETDNCGRTAVHIEVENGHTEGLKFLIEKGADHQVADGNGVTTIQKAGSKGHMEIWKLLKYPEELPASVETVSVNSEMNVSCCHFPNS